MTLCAQGRAGDRGALRENRRPTTYMPRNPEIAYDILRDIRRILRKVAQHSRQLSRDAGLTVPQLLCLRAVAALNEEGETTVVGVGRRVHLSPSAVSRVLDRLERAGLVLRERTAQDRRKVCLSLTPAGHRRLRDLPTPLQEQFVQRVLELRTDEREALQSALHRIVDLMEASDLSAAPMLAPEESVQRDDGSEPEAAAHPSREVADRSARNPGRGGRPE